MPLSRYRPELMGRATIEPTGAFEAGGLGRRVRLARLPDENPHRALSFGLDAALAAGRDNPLRVKATQEDGHAAWSSPIYVIRG